MVRLNLERSPREDALPLEGCISEIIGKPIGGFDFEIRKKSIDARRNKVKFVYTVDIFVHSGDEEALASRCGGAVIEKEDEYRFPESTKTPDKRPVIAGFGPAGIFVALCLARSGMRPIVLERG
jgi:uncharacterized FAD-dependent dehydrogenase